MRERRTRHLRACRGEEKEKEVLASGKREGGRGRERGGECVLACFQGEDSQGARHRERGGGSVEGPCSVTLLGGVCKWRGGEKRKKVIRGGFQGRDTSCQREGQRCEESPGGRGSMLERKTLAVAEKHKEALQNMKR